VVAGGWLVLDPALDHGVQCVVELAVAVAVEPIPGGDLAAAGMGATPASIANAASEWIRPGWDQAHNTVAATIGPTPNGGFNWSSQHLVSTEVFDGSTTAGSRSGVASEVEVAWSSEVQASCRGGVLGADCQGAPRRGGRRRSRRGAGGRCALVPQRWRHAAFDLKFQPSGRFLCFAEREEIALLRAKDKSVREIARAIGRDPGTISRELRRNAARRSGSSGYRASVVQWKADIWLRVDRRP